MGRSALLAVALMCAFPAVACADGPRAEPGTWHRAWNWDPLILAILGLLGWLYGRGLVRLWGQVGWGKKVEPWRGGAFYVGLLVILTALVSPLDALSEELSSLHMVQHMLLTMVAAPLVALGAPTVVVAWGVPELWEGKNGRWLRSAFRLQASALLWQPWFVWALFAFTLWIWHQPAFYQAALRDLLVHDAQHVSFFVAAYLFWRLIVDPVSNRRLRGLAAIPYLFATSLHASALGIFLALSPRVWYEHYVGRTEGWGLTPLEDQQLAGLIMWMPGCLIYAAVAALLLATWLAHPSRQRPTPKRQYAVVAQQKG